MKEEIYVDFEIPPEVFILIFLKVYEEKMLEDQASWPSQRGVKDEDFKA